MFFPKVILLSAFSLILSAPAMADGPAPNNFAKKRPDLNGARSAPAVKQDKIIIIRNGKPVGVIEAKAARTAPAAGIAAGTVASTGCRNEGLADIGAAPLQFVHVPLPTGWGGFPSERYIDNVQGKASYDGRIYDLKLATVFKRDFRPFSGVSFPMQVRFDYVDANGDHVTVDVPVREGAANPALEKILSVQNALLDPEDLLPQSRQYSIAGSCDVMGKRMNELVMTQPIEASPAQIERFTQ